MMRWPLRSLALLLLILPTLPTSLQAQDEPTCPIAIEDVLLQTLEACSGTPRDHLCHSGTAGLPGTAGSFIPLSESNNIASSSEAYSVALVNTSASLPLTLGEQGITFLTLGAVDLENAVLPEQMLAPVEPIAVTTTTASNLRSRPGSNHTVIASVNAGVELMADGLSADGEWLRVTIDDNPAWISRTLVSGAGIDQLPPMQENLRSTMQEFTLNTAEETICDNAPNVLVIQSLEVQPTLLTVNGADMQIRGTVALRSFERPFSTFVDDPAWFGDHNLLLPTDTTIAPETVCRFTELSAIDGDAFLNNYRFSIPRGFSAFSFECGQNETPVWARANPISPQLLNALTVLNELPEGTLRYTINVPEPQEVAQIASQLAAAVASTSSTSSDSESGVQPTGDCGGFVPTHPITGVHFGWVRFYWDPAPGATSYRVNLYNWADEFSGTFATEGPETSVRVSTMSFQFSKHDDRMPPMSYEVIAYQDGNVMCTTPRVHLRRDFDPDPDCPPSMWFSGQCEDYIANIP